MQSKINLKFKIKISGDDSGGETPVPIPNTAVKPSSADGTWVETPWESRSLPGYFKSLRFLAWGLIYFVH
jgi:hypothetical protein